jgi:hypothetical protein
MLVKLIICVLLFVVIPAFIFFRIVFSAKFKTRYFVKNGVPRVAKIISIGKTSMQYGPGKFTNVEMVLEIENSKSSTNKVTIKQMFETVKTPGVGDKILILIDPKKPGNVILSPNQENVNG